MSNFSTKGLKELYKKGDLKSIARELPHFKEHNDNRFVKFLLKSNILTMGNWLEKELITLGADPEFIVCNDKTKEIVLFSSRYATDTFNLSKADIGADYGLLEFRTCVFDTPEKLTRDVEQKHKEFIKQFGSIKKEDGLEIVEIEAINFNYQRKRILETMSEEDAINYGLTFGGKSSQIWTDPLQIENDLPENITMSAYGKSIFFQPNTSIFTAGGHIHIGGAYTKMLSFPQLLNMIVKIDKEVRPISEKIETEAGKLRRTIYGFPGEFRLKEYGFEYRSLSNAIFWPKNLEVLKKVLEDIVEIVTTFGIEETREEK